MTLAGDEEQSLRLQKFLKRDEANERAVVYMITNSDYVLAGNAFESVIGINFLPSSYWEHTQKHSRAASGICSRPARCTVYR